MIRINLLEEQRATQRAAVGISVPTLPQENLLYYVLQAAIPIVVILVVVGWGWRNHQKIEQLNADIKKEQAELDRLQAVIKLNEELEAKRDLLRRKIEVITKLKRNQDVPVRMLDQLSKNLAEYLWLTRMRVQGERTINLQGMTNSEYAVATFMRNLQNSPFFDNIRPKGMKKSRSLYSWELTVNFVLPEEKAEPAQVQKAEK